MTTTEHWMAVGIFEDQAKAEQAIHELHQAGFHDDQISYAGHGASSSGILASLKRLFTGQDTTSGTITDDLVERGMMPEADARYYQQEYEAGRSLVAVMTDGRSLQEATTILTRNGAYGAKEQAQVWTFEHPLQQADSHRPILLQVHAPGIVHAGINREGKWIRTYDVPLEEVAPGVWEAYLLDSEINELTFSWSDPDQPGKVLWEGKNYPLPR